MYNLKIVKVKYVGTDATLEIGEVKFTLTEDGIMTVRQGDKVITFIADSLHEFMNSAGHTESY